jgi:DIS3-like exonuclease 2
MEGLDDVVRIAKTVMNFDIDTSSSQSLHDSLIRFSRVCDSLLLQCFTNLLMTPMQAAEYFAAGTRSSEEWRHYALNIPYYTHFTSPIRRYPDVMVHRLLQASIDGKAAVENFPADVKRLERICVNGNVKKKASKDAQERCDRVFLSLFLHKHPKHSELGVVISVGKSTFDVYLPSIGVNAKLFLPEHKDLLTYASEENEEDGSKRILLQQKPEAKTGDQWKTLEIVVFTKLSVSILCRDRPPVDIRLRLEGPWKGDET